MFEDLTLAQVFSMDTLVSVLDIVIVAVLVYQVIQLFRNTRVIQILNGVAVILIMKLISSLIGLQTTEFIIDFVIQWSAIALIVIFAPELRKALEHIGRGAFLTEKEQGISERMVDETVEAVQYMAKRKIGALIAIEREAPLNEYVKTGIPLESILSSQLLINIFIPNTPLHDGAVIIQDKRISSAASYLPLSESPTIPKKYGTRHRAALGLSEETDALTLIVSEETGTVSVTSRGKIYADLNEQDLKDYLYKELVPEEEEAGPLQSLWNRITGKGGSKSE